MAIIDDAAQIYGCKHTIAAVAHDLHISQQKARKLLITAGIIQPEMARQALYYRSRGLELTEIAGKLGVTVKALQSYLPYTRAPYNQPMRSENAVKLSRWREKSRME